MVVINVEILKFWQAKTAKLADLYPVVQQHDKMNNKNTDEDSSFLLDTNDRVPIFKGANTWIHAVPLTKVQEDFQVKTMTEYDNYGVFQSTKIPVSKNLKSRIDANHLVEGSFFIKRSQRSGSIVTPHQFGEFLSNDSPSKVCE